MRRYLWPTLLAVLISACAPLQTTPPAMDTASSAFQLSNDPAQPPWRAVDIRFKTPSRYTRAEIDGVACVLGEANASWSLYAASVPQQFARGSRLSWRWYVPRLPAGADNETVGKDDAAVRVVIAFKGDRSKIDAADRAAMNMAQLIGGWEIPYASIQYIWEPDAKPETVIPHHTVSRIKTVVVRSGDAGLASWVGIERNVREDFRRVFNGEEPGEIESIGIMTDADGLGGVNRGCYADIVLR